ncbi:MAG: polymer-forming cytoskeletal protein [Myxococcota bacterium]
MADPAATIGEGFRLSGTLRGTGGVRVEGSVDGGIHVDEQVTVAPQGMLRADVEAGSLAVHGTARGSVKTQRAEVKAGSTLEGSMQVETLVVEEGARLQCNLQMALDLPPDDE